MFASLAGDVLGRVGPFVVPVVLFAGGVTVYALLWLFYRWRDETVTGDDATHEE